MIALLLLAVLSTAPPELVVVATSDRARTRDAVTEVTRAVRDALVREGAESTPTVDAALSRVLSTGFGDPKRCAGARRCLEELALVLGPRSVLISVDVGKIARRLSIHLEVHVDSELLEETDLIADADRLEESLALGVTLFARQVLPRLERPALVVADAPRSVPLTPALTTPGIVFEPAPQPRRVVLPVIATGAAVVAAGLSVTFSILGASAQGDYERARISGPGGTGSSLTHAQASALADRANQNYSVALGTGITAALLGGVSGWLWVTR